jgi:hypothetical protein
MKPGKMLLCVIAAFPVIAFLSGCTRPNDKLYYGTFTQQGFPQKTVRTPDGFKDYATPSDDTPLMGGTTKIIKSWTDSEGSTWFQTQATIDFGPYKTTVPKAQTLEKLSKDGKVLEFMWNGVVEFSGKSFPLKIDQRATNYRLYKRVEQ